MWVWLLLAACAAWSGAEGAGAGAARLVCYVENARANDGFSECTHLVYTGNDRGDKLDTQLKEYRKNNPRLKIVLRVAEVDKDLRNLLKSKHVQGLEVYDAHRSLNKTSVVETVEAARSAISSAGGGPLFLALPAHPELLAKYYDLRTLVKKVDLLMVQTHALGQVKKMTYHPSRLSGVWDMMNTDSVVDLVVGLGVPASKIVISLPATARQFTLQNETLSTPGSPTTEDEPKEIDQAELCRQLQKGRWTLERDQDLSAPYAFKDKTWISFEDASSVDVKGKYARVRGLAGLALHKADRDVDTSCAPTLKHSLAKVLNQQSRAPRAAVLRSLEHEILSAPGHARALDALQVSPYRITQVVDSDGVIHSIREDTRTEFSCSRQGYFVHPRSCARFYRCVKFDQLSPEFTVFEFDCPAGLAFDSRYEVCVWPGSLPHSQACPGSSEIAPVPHTRFICPEYEGYYADPENCRWFFACLDHGKAPLTAYEFRCPFGLGFDAEKLKCDWPWLVPACGNIARYEAEAHGFSAAILTGAAGFQGQTADSINVAAHQSLVSGASLNNLVGIQGGFLTSGDSLDSNFIASQELANGGADYQFGHGAITNNGALENHASELSLNGNVGLVQATRYNDGEKYTSGSLILDDYRLPTKAEVQTKAIHGAVQSNSAINVGQATLYQNQGRYNKVYNVNKNNGYTSSSYASGNSDLKSIRYEGANNEDNSGAYVHDPSGDYAEPYKHVDSPVEPYVNDASGYKQSNEYYNYGKYSGSSQNEYDGKYFEDNSGQYVHDKSGSYVESSLSNGGYKNDYSGSYHGEHSGSYNGGYSGSYISDDSRNYEAGVYREGGHIGSYKNNNEVTTADIQQYQGSYSNANLGNYLENSKAYTGVSHTLTAGAVNVGLVGKTTLIDTGYSDQNNYQFTSTGAYNSGSKSIGHEIVHQTLHPGHVSIISQPAVSVSHVGTDSHNLDGYNYVTTPTSSGVPTTATPFAITTSLPVVTSYKTTLVPEAPKSSIKQIFGYTQPEVTYGQQNLVTIKEQFVTPKTNYDQGLNYEYVNKDYSSSNNYAAGVSINQEATAVKSESSGYSYPKPAVKFEDGLAYTTASPIASVSTYQPEGFSHSQQTIHKVEAGGYEYSTPTPIKEEPFKKIIAYTTGPSVTTYAEPTAVTYAPHSFSHQTIHNVEANKVYSPSIEGGSVGYDYTKSDVKFEEPKSVVHYTTASPSTSDQIVSTHQPQSFSHQILHTVDASHVNTYSQESLLSGYEYKEPTVKFEEIPKTVQYSTPAPEVAYKPHSYSHQTIHKVETKEYVPVSSTPVPKIELNYQSSIDVNENPYKYTHETLPETVSSAYIPQSYSHQTLHKVEGSKVSYSPSVEVGSYEYTKPSYSFEEPKTVIQYNTPQPSVETISNYEPQVYSHQTLHKVEASKVNTYSQDTSYSGYVYDKPAIKFEEAPRTVIHNTPNHVASSTYKPQSYSHQTIHKVETQKYVPTSVTPKIEVSYQQPEITVSTYKPQVYSHQTIHFGTQNDSPKQELTYRQPDVTVYENPILKYSEKVAPVTYVKPINTEVTHTYQPIVQQHQVNHIISQPVQLESAQHSYSGQNLQVKQEGYSYSQPEIQRNLETSDSVKYSDASIVSHQVFHLSNEKSEHNAEGQYDYDISKKIETYKAPEYIPPKSNYEQAYSVISKVSAPIVQHQSSVVHKTQDEYDYKPVEYSQQYERPVQQVSFSTSKNEGSIHVATKPGTTITTKYKLAYESPEIQSGYKAEEYLPPVISAPAVTTYKPPTYSTIATTREYLPPAEPKYEAPEYLPPAVDNVYSAPSTTAKSFVQQSPSYIYAETTTYKAPEYLPPVESGSNVISFESFGLKNIGESGKISFNSNQEYTVSNSAPEVPVYRKQNLVVQTAKSHLLGFGTVGPDAGLVSQVTYTTPSPTYKSFVDVTPSSSYAQKSKVISNTVNHYLSPSTTDETFVKSTTQLPTYNYVKSTTQYKAPEYLPPLEDTSENVDNLESSVSTNSAFEGNNRFNHYQENNLSQRKHNIVVETAKSQLLGYGTVGSDAGIADSVRSTYVPEKQELVEVVPTHVPSRRTRPKVAVVTKINDFNPFLVRKLGAVCSCQSPVLVLKGKRPNVDVQQDFDDYSNGYDDSSRGDINDDQWAYRTAKSQIAELKTATASPIVTSSFNPIIVPDDSFYQDYQEISNNKIVSITPSREIYSESFISSAPTATTEKVLRIRPQSKTVTVAPTYKTILLNQEVTPTSVDKESYSASIESQSFDRYGPGGWRSRDETLQGSVDCQRAGLFRHPKQCNKFYACRWDCTKQRFTLHVFNCPIQLSFDPNIGACNWPSQGPSCQGDTLLTNAL